MMTVDEKVYFDGEEEEGILPSATEQHDHEEDASLPSVSFQVFESRNINDKVDAMREQVEVGENSTYPYGFDCEWDTEATRRGEGRRKVGKVATIQLSYLLDGVTQALVLKLPTKSNKLPHQLESFLTDPKVLFVGFNISNDFNLLGNDYCIPSLAQKVNSLALGMMTRERDIVQRGNPHCEEVVERVLGFKLDKSNEVRCSKWSATQLSNKQEVYAALDVIKPLEAYYKMLEMPDLSQRIDPESCQPGVIVDVVPPHARNNRCKAGIRRLGNASCSRKDCTGGQSILSFWNITRSCQG